MKKTLLAASLVIGALANSFAQRVVNFNNTTLVGYTSIYPLSGDATSTACGYFTPNAVYSASSSSDGIRITKATPGNGGYAGVYIGFASGQPDDCNNVQLNQINLTGSNQNIYVVVTNNSTDALTLQSLLGTSEGSANNDYANNASVASSATSVFTFDYTGKWFCKYSCTPTVGTAGDQNPAIPLNNSLVQQFFLTPNGGNATAAIDFTIKAVGAGYQTFEATQTSVITTFTGANTSNGSVSQVQVATIFGGILTGAGTVSGSNVTGGSFEVSLSSTSGFANNVVLTPTNGIVAPTPVYVRFRSTTGATAGTKTGSLTAVGPNSLPNVSPVTAVVGVATEYVDYQFASLVSIAPNPTSEGYINVNTDLNVSNIAVMNAQGALVNAPVNGNRVNTANLTPGVYTLLIDTEKGRTAKKVVVE